jgi:hypothetical protein
MSLVASLARRPTNPGQMALFGALNDGSVRGMHFGGLVRPRTESEYLGPEIGDGSVRIRFQDMELGSIRTPNPGCI